MVVGEYCNLNVRVHGPVERYKNNRRKTPLPSGYPARHCFYFIKEILEDGYVLVGAGLSHDCVRIEKPGILWKVSERDLEPVSQWFIDKFYRQAEKINLALHELQVGRRIE